MVLDAQFGPLQKRWGRTVQSNNLAIFRSFGDCHANVKSKLGILFEAYILRATVWWFLNL